MISVSGKKWVKKTVNKNSVEKIKQDYNFTDILSHLIVSRNFDITEINGIENNLKLNNIFKNNPDFQEAISILIDIINKKENICILGDYDVDGSCSTSLLVRYFNHINQKHFYYIPDRIKDGYGASIKLFKKLILKKPKLIIMVDCGSNSYDAVNFLNENNIKSIIIDHHEINKPYPKCNAIINPKKEIINNESKYLCATALTYFFIDTLLLKTKSDFKLYNFLIYVLLATICDVMPLRKINRIIADNAIKDFSLKNNAAFSFIFDQFNLNKKISVDDLGFLIGPIINAGGRLGFSNYGVELLSSDKNKIVQDICLKLIKLNEKRKKIEQNILDEIDLEKIKSDNKNIIIYINENINEGLIGIIAARLKDYFNKPSIVITKSNHLLKASARSTSTYNIGHLIKLLIDNKIIEKGGGHNMAAGFVIKKNNIKLLDKFIQNDYSKKNYNTNILHHYDFDLSASAINTNFIKNLNKLQPFGNYNDLPTFYIKDVKILKSNLVNKKHISAIIKPKIGSSFKSICFNCLNDKLRDHLLFYKNKINIIGQIHENVWNNKKKVQLNIKDLIL